MLKLLLCSALLLTATGCRTPLRNAADRPAAWGTPLELPGVKNLYKLDDNLYRSAQPETPGFEELEKLGIKTVLCLRSGRSDLIPAASSMLRVLYVNTTALTLSDNDILDAMRILGNKNQGPYLVHCFHGSDRTGAICAAYRILYNGWTKDEALEEMKYGGYGYHSVFANLRNRIKNMDTDAMRNSLNIKEFQNAKEN